MIGRVSRDCRPLVFLFFFHHKISYASNLDSIFAEIFEFKVLLSILSASGNFGTFDTWGLLKCPLLNSAETSYFPLHKRVVCKLYIFLRIRVQITNILIGSSVARSKQR
jgi:hypothetical protein